MKLQIVLLIIEAVALASWILFLRLTSNSKIINAEKISMVADWAYRLAVNAKNMLPDSTGEEKKENVMNELKSIAEKNRFDLNDFQLSSFVEEAYEKMKKGEYNG